MNRLTGKVSSIEEMIEVIRKTPEIMAQVSYWHTIPLREAKTESFPDSLRPELRDALQHKQIHQLYTHQAASFREVAAGKHVVTVTPTASGKTLCYNLPVIQRVLENESTRALYLFPTKALAQDQVSELQGLVGFMGVDLKTHTYDGDTPPNVRQVIRNAGHIVVTNPDMLHSAILPHHTKWAKLFKNLEFIVIDEVHSYRGVFGSHMANVIRRLKRICKFYGSNPQFICASATIANPKEHAEKLIGEKISLIDNNGAPAGMKHFVFYNPPVVNQALGIRRSSVLETRKLAGTLLRNGIQTIVFARSRVRVEILLTYLQESVRHELGNKTIRGYRGGYLPKQRREIERGLRTGEIRGVVSTNALELGIDIGQLQACVLNGYPGTIGSTWQQSGRAGCRQESSLTILVASSNPLDQYMIQNPRFFFERPAEQERIHPDKTAVAGVVLYGDLNQYEANSHLDDPVLFVESFRVLPLSDPKDFDLYEAIEFIEQVVPNRHDIDVYNLSFGPTGPIFDDEISRFTYALDTLAWNYQKLFVVAVGNDGEAPSPYNRVQAPADLVNGLGVGAYTFNYDTAERIRASYSCIGDGREGCKVKPDVCAFGGDSRYPIHLIKFFRF
ncbi:YprA [Paenibacillus larvae subsp. larvae DSM 25719]|uniref:DEAD/DEAH box helicase n=1 Tax=Paenibacillus larvae TaxID=1464 RepID=UPI0003DC7184|nr:DEAD/DEAH box helicase [Paenibacillus larvae]ETK27897.1 YprA [Paenibacillus larvae subsp. larvae DSM 25719]